ncbi:signal recognition particle 14kD protein [Rutstroemia sp. NJR-2017a WRK4]|nr:signal recognition particle 14kD protein [Rutstroemia sp. NJR-2017a WRK4]
MESHSSNDEFFAKLTELFDTRRQKDHGSVFLTQKTLTYGLDASSTEPLPILIRATNGTSKTDRAKRKIKLSTVVQPDQLEGFFLRYAEICKGGMSALKKRDRSKAKEKQKAKKRKMGMSTAPQPAAGEDKK